MRALLALLSIQCLCAGAALAAPIPCSDIPDAQLYVDKLKPGPNTTLAQRHLEAAKQAKSARECDKELRQVDKYARRSAAADAKAAHKPDKAEPRAPSDEQAAQKPDKPEPRAAGRPQCADLLHQDRPGGTDYHGPPVAGCPRR